MAEIDFTDKYWGDYSGVGLGWHQIVLDLDQKLRAEAPGFTFSQIKEKFGGLRAYLFFGEDASDEVRERAYRLTDAAEAQAWRTCEKCGEPGRLREDRSWLLTLCDDCDTKEGGLMSAAEDQNEDDAVFTREEVLGAREAANSIRRAMERTPDAVHIILANAQHRGTAALHEGEEGR